ncbi:MAG: hypothetical protein R3C49_19465 [Planctomycetaceae bacterium]
MKNRRTHSRKLAIETFEPMVLMSATISGTEGDDWINSDADDNMILALGGNDYIYAPLGNNLIDGGAGNDTLVIYEGLFEQYDISRNSAGNVVVQGPALNGQVNTNELCQR